MKFPTIIPAFLAATSSIAFVNADHGSWTAAIYIQPITPPPGTAAAAAAEQPALLAEIAIPDNRQTQDSETHAAEVLAYEAPDLDLGFNSDSTSRPQQQPPTPPLRIGVYNSSTREWLSPTSVVSASNFAKGYAPHFVLTVDDDDGQPGEDGGAFNKILGVTCRGVRIDAGQTRDFGPQAVVLRAGKGAQPALGKPVILSLEGKRRGPGGEGEEKSFLQKYWWAIAIGAFLLLSGGGGGQE